MKNIFYVLFALVTLLSCSEKEISLPPPNILWVTAEDITTMLGTYGDVNATTPQLDAFAQRSVQYTNAFATAPVCSPSRSCLITGHQAATLGSQHLRSTVPIPEHIVPFPKHLRQAGYFTTNNAKEDYNFIDTTIWHESSHQAHWRQRPGDQPFFSVFNLTLTHQSAIFGNDSVYQARVGEYLPLVTAAAPDSLVLPPYYPDTPVIRQLWARYYTNVSIIDYQFGEILKQLEADGLAERTIVFFYADHGTGMPRAKRALYDSGLKVPLLIHVPEPYAEHFNVSPGTHSEQMISFVDFAPTVLALAGMNAAENYPGRPFLPRQPVDEDKYVYGTSDRVDEGYELARTIRTQQYRYIRNFLPHLPLIQPNYYSDQSEIMKELHRLRSANNLTEAQMTLYASERQPEELYDTVNDPHELHNLAGDPQYQKVLEELRQTLVDETKKTHDTGFLPEPDMLRLAENSTPYAVAHNPELYPLAEIVETCQLMLSPQPSAEALLERLNHDNGLVRYWAVVTVQYRKVTDPAVQQRLQALLDDPLATVQVEAAKTLVKFGDTEAVATMLQHMEAENDPLVLFATRAFQEVSDRLPHLPERARTVFEKMAVKTQQGSTFYDYYKVYTYWALVDLFSS